MQWEIGLPSLYWPLYLLTLTDWISGLSTKMRKCHNLIVRVYVYMYASSIYFDRMLSFLSPIHRIYLNDWRLLPTLILFDWLHVVSRPLREYFTNIKTSPWPIKRCQNQGLCALPTTLENWWIVISCHTWLCVIRRTTRLCCLYCDKPWVLKTYLNPDSHGTIGSVSVPSITKDLKRQSSIVYFKNTNGN